MSSDVTFSGAVGPEGTVRVTLTPDLSGVTRVELANAVFQVTPPGGSPLSFNITNALYYAPPSPVEAGQFSVGVPGNLVGQARASARIDGSVSADGASGTATLVACFAPSGCQDWTTTSWTASGPTPTPPNEGDAIMEGRIEGRAGQIAVALDPDDQRVTAFEVEGLSLEPCLSEPLSMRAFDLTTPPEVSGSLLQHQEGLRALAVSISHVDGDSASGSLHFASGFYVGDCAFDATWTAGATEPTAPIPPEGPSPTAPAGGLPETGGGAGGTSGVLAIVAALAGVGVAALVVGGSSREA
jgi:hypothetical protein